MPYQSRHRNYQSRRERNARTGRVARILVVSVLLFAAIFAFMNRYWLYGWLKTYFY